MSSQAVAAAIQGSKGGSSPASHLNSLPSPPAQGAQHCITRPGRRALPASHKGLYDLLLKSGLELCSAGRAQHQIRQQAQHFSECDKKKQVHQALDQAN